MQPIVPLLLTAIILAATASAAERTLLLRHAEAGQAQQELATAVRALLRFEKVDLDAGRLTVVGAEDQIQAAEWLLAELDRPAAGERPRARCL
jgi:hypothetical protein